MLQTATDLTPTFLTSDDWSREHLRSAIALFNSLVASGLQAFEAANQGITAKVIDTSVPFNKAIENPGAYGAPNASCFNNDGVSCVSETLALRRRATRALTTSQLWFNDYHPGTAIQRLVAQDVAAAWSGFFEA